jgi:hypothetical protein
MPMVSSDLEHLCQTGQDQLSRMEYLEAEHTLAAAEELAWAASDWDHLSRLYLPLQEARRQRRQRCGEGAIRLTNLAARPGDHLDGPGIVERLHHGQTLIAGWGSLQPTLDARAAQRKLDLYVDVFLAAVYPVDSGRIVALVPTEDVSIPRSDPMPVDALIRRLPAHTILLTESELAAATTYAATMALWERLHAPFLAAAQSTNNPIHRIEAFRKTIRVDYACELAHQGISDTARKLCIGVHS